MTTCSQHLTTMQSILNISSPGSDTQSKLIVASNLVLQDSVRDRLDYYHTDVYIDVPATLDLTITCIGATQATYVSGDNYFDHAGLIAMAYNGDWYGRIVEHDSITRTIIPNRDFPSLTSEDYSFYPLGYNLDAQGLVYDINGASQTDLTVASVHGVYVDGSLIESYNEYYEDPTPCGKPTGYRWQAPYLYFTSPTADAFVLHLKLFRKPKLLPSTYSANALIDWPSGWEYYFALLCCRQYALLERDDKQYAMLDRECERLKKSFLREQNSLHGNLYSYQYNASRHLRRGRLDRTLR